jgi:hypothetical protein
MFFMIIATLVVGGLIILYKWLEGKRVANEQKAKENRAKTYAASQQALAAAIRQQEEAAAARTTLICETLERVNTTLTYLSHKTDGRLPEGTSKKIVNAAFTETLLPLFCNIFRRSIEENDFLPRELLVTRKVKAALRVQIVKQKEFLENIPLSIESDKYFTVEEVVGNGTGDSAVEHYVLSERLWTAVRPFYLGHKENLKQRIEDAHVAIETTVQEYLTEIEETKCHLP